MLNFSVILLVPALEQEPITEYMLFRTALRITEYLIDDGLITPPAVTPEIEGSPEQLIREFDNWLSHNQGLSETTRIFYRSAFQLFLDYICTTFGGVGALSSLTLGTIYEFLDDHSGKNGWWVSFIRNILRFLFWSGRTSRDLSSAIPPVAARRHKNVIRHVDPETVGKLLAVIRGDTPLSLRDYAALLLMVRLGLRVEEVVAMRLGDIDWAIGRVLIRGVIYHQTETRSEGHLMISVLAYQAVQLLRTLLKSRDVNDSWHSLRKSLRPLQRTTTRFSRPDGSALHIRKTATPDAIQNRIYQSMGVTPPARNVRKTIV